MGGERESTKNTKNQQTFLIAIHCWPGHNQDKKDWTNKAMPPKWFFEFFYFLINFLKEVKSLGDHLPPNFSGNFLNLFFLPTSLVGFPWEFHIFLVFILLCVFFFIVLFPFLPFGLAQTNLSVAWRTT